MISTRDRIIQVTSELLEAQGYHGTGLNQIVAESGAPKGSLYHYFPEGKEELTTEAISRSGQAITARIRASLAGVDDAAEAVCSFILTVATYVEASGYSTGGPVTTVALETASTNERLRAICKGVYDLWQGAFAEKLLKSGYSPPRAAALSALIVASLEGAIVLSRTHRSTVPLEQIASELKTLLQFAKGE